MGGGFCIECPAALVVHSGDYKFDHTPGDTGRRLFQNGRVLNAGVPALLSDSSTRIARLDAIRTGDRRRFNRVFREAEGRFILPVLLLIFATCRVPTP
jgi:ribonuclease J